MGELEGATEVMGLFGSDMVADCRKVKRYVVGLCMRFQRILMISSLVGRDPLSDNF